MAREPVAFAHLLRAAGLQVPVGSTVLFTQALGALGGVEREHDVYWAGRATLVRRPEDIPTYDSAFAAFWHNAPAPPRSSAIEQPIQLGIDTDGADGGDEPGPDDTPVPTFTVRYSQQEVLRHKDFADCSSAELDEARRLMADLRLGGARRRARRMRPTHRRRAGAGTQPDLRRSVRRSLRAGGEATALARRAPTERPRRVILLVDISGSMEPYARALVRFAHAAVAGRRRVEVFSLGTRLTRLTRELSTHDPDVALHRAADAARDWSGGTRLGEGLTAFNDDWGVRGLARGAVVVILSDGWDRGDPDELAGQMARLRRVAHRIVWVNPLKATAGYEPLARGMAAALPYVDEFIEGHSLASLETLAEVVSR